MDVGQKQWEEALCSINNKDGFLLSPYYAHALNQDIKHLMFVFSRYKFAAKMMENRVALNVLELGCNHGLGTKFFRQSKSCDQIVGIDFDGAAIKWAKQNFGDEQTKFIEDNFLNQDYTTTLMANKFDAIISIDVIEHIAKEKEKDFLHTIDLNLKENGFVIIGTPNITMNPYASEASRIGHINLYDQKRLYDLLHKKFHQVFIFGMNDEVLHTGFHPMSCYIMALCCHKKIV